MKPEMFILVIGVVMVVIGLLLVYGRPQIIKPDTKTNDLQVIKEIVQKPLERKELPELELYYEDTIDSDSENNEVQDVVLNKQDIVLEELGGN